jgi:hypothetical protein
MTSRLTRLALTVLLYGPGAIGAVNDIDSRRHPSAVPSHYMYANRYRTGLLRSCWTGNGLRFLE